MVSAAPYVGSVVQILNGAVLQAVKLHVVVNSCFASGMECPAVEEPPGVFASFIGNEMFLIR